MRSKGIKKYSFKYKLPYLLPHRVLAKSLNVSTMSSLNVNFKKVLAFACRHTCEGQKRVSDPLDLRFRCLWASHCGSWEPISGPLEKQQVFLNAEPSLQSSVCRTFKCLWWISWATVTLKEHAYSNSCHFWWFSLIPKILFSPQIKGQQLLSWRVMIARVMVAYLQMKVLYSFAYASER